MQDSLNSNQRKWPQINKQKLALHVVHHILEKTALRLKWIYNYQANWSMPYCLLPSNRSSHTEVEADKPWKPIQTYLLVKTMPCHDDVYCDIILGTTFQAHGHWFSVTNSSVLICMHGPNPLHCHNSGQFGAHSLKGLLCKVKHIVWNFKALKWLS